MSTRSKQGAAIRQLVDLLTGAPGRTAMTLQLRDWAELPTERVPSLQRKIIEAAKRHDIGVTRKA